MKNNQSIFNTLPALLTLIALFCFGVLGRAQSVPAPDNKPVQDNDTTRRDLAQFDRFLDSHQEIAEQLRKNPSLVNNKDFVEQHPALRTYLQQQPGIREELRENPNAFMRREDNFDRHEDARDRDTTRKDLAQFDQFLDSHREISEQLRKDPSLVNNREFVQQHPALQTYLQQQPGVREEIKENPNAFMRQEDNFDRHEGAPDRDKTNDHDRLTSFKGFLGDHSSISQELSKDPSLAKNHEYVENHPELQAYLKAHPDVQDELMKNPQNFVKSAQTSTNDSEPVKTPKVDNSQPNYSQPNNKAPKVDAKPMQ